MRSSRTFAIGLCLISASVALAQTSGRQAAPQFDVRLRPNADAAGVVTSIDIAPTLARILNVEPPSNATGRVLGEAFK